MKLSSTEAEILKTEINAVGESMKPSSVLELDNCKVRIWPLENLGGVKVIIVPKAVVKAFEGDHSRQTESGV